MGSKGSEDSTVQWHIGGHMVAPVHHQVIHQCDSHHIKVFLVSERAEESCWLNQGVEHLDGSNMWSHHATGLKCAKPARLCEGPVEAKRIDSGGKRIARECSFDVQTESVEGPAHEQEGVGTLLGRSTMSSDSLCLAPCPRLILFLLVLLCAAP